MSESPCKRPRLEVASQISTTTIADSCNATAVNLTVSNSATPVVKDENKSSILSNIVNNGTSKLTKKDEDTSSAAAALANASQVAVMLSHVGREVQVRFHSSSMFL